jgi:hypothetical protein
MLPACFKSFSYCVEEPALNQSIGLLYLLFDIDAKRRSSDAML